MEGSDWEGQNSALRVVKQYYEEEGALFTQHTLRARAATCFDLFIETIIRLNVDMFILMMALIIRSKHVVALALKVRCVNKAP